MTPEAELAEARRRLAELEAAERQYRQLIEELPLAVYRDEPVATAVEGYRLSPPLAASVAIVFGLVLGGSAAIGVALGWTKPYWVPEPILILVLYVLIGKRDRIRGKAIGTALGVAAAIPVAIIDPPAGVLAAVAAIAFVLALTQAKK